MSKTTVLVFNGGSVGGDDSCSVHNLQLGVMTVNLPDFHASSMYVLLDKSIPIESAPGYAPVDRYALADWIQRGDVIQVDCANITSETDTSYAGALQSTTAVNQQGHVYTSTCTIRLDIESNNHTESRYYRLEAVHDTLTDIWYLGQDVNEVTTIINENASNKVQNLDNNSSHYPSCPAVKEAIDTTVASAYHAAGTKTVAQLTSALLVAENQGNVYNITDSGTTTADFVDGAGHPINAGDNVGICDVGGGVYKFDLLSGFVDLSGYLAKTGDGSDVTATFTAASTRTNVSTGEKLSVLFGKIAKWFGDFKALAFKDNITDSDISGTISDAHIASASTWNVKQDAISTDTDSSTIGDATTIATGYGSNKVHLNTVARLWAYIQDKISSVLGLTSSSYGGKAASLNASAGGPSQPVYFPSSGADLGKPVAIPMSTDQEVAAVGDFLTIQAQGAYYAHKAGNAATAEAVAWANVSGKPNASSSVPISDGYVGSEGVSTDYARADHIHADNIIVIPALTYTTIGVEVNNKVEYLKAWLKYVWANYQAGIVLQKEVVGVLIPGVNGIAHGQFYGGSGTSVDGYPKHSFFTAIFWGGSHVTYYFGTENGTFYISNGNVDNLTSMSTEYALSANQGRILNGLIASKADDSSVVHLAGAETITGVKTFNSNETPKWMGPNGKTRQSKFIVTNNIKDYANWTADEKDGNHYRQWSIDITSIIKSLSSYSIIVDFQGSWQSGSSSGHMTKLINCLIGNSTLASSEADYLAAQAPCSNKYVVSGLIKESSSYKIKIVNNSPTSNNYPMNLVLSVTSSTSISLADVEATGEIIEGWPTWAGTAGAEQRITCNGTEVMLKGDNADSATDATYSTKIGSSSSHPAIGSATQPVYVDGNGAVKPCENRIHDLTLQRKVIRIAGEITGRNLLCDRQNWTGTVDAPVFTPVDPYVLADWINRGDVIQVDFTTYDWWGDKYPGLIVEAQCSTLSGESRLICTNLSVLRKKIVNGQATVNFAWSDLITDEDTNIKYMEFQSI